MNTLGYLSGPPICGLWGIFEEDFGDSSTPSPYPRVTPSRLGAALLPFRCPRCEATIDWTDKTVREWYHDTRVVDGRQRNNYWCPSCGTRFLLNDRGKDFDGKIVAGAALSVVERITVGSDGLVNVARVVSRGSNDYVYGCDVLGSC